MNAVKERPRAQKKQGVKPPVTDQVSNDQVISFLRMVISPSVALRQDINRFLKARTDRRYLFFVAERSLAKLEHDGINADVGSTERHEDDEARQYNAVDLRKISRLKYRTSQGACYAFERVDEGSFIRTVSQATRN